MKTLGQIAYEAFTSGRDLHSPLVPWEKLPETAKRRWERVAQAVKKA